MTEGYNHFAAVLNVPKDPVIWKNIWECKTLPKLDLFSWTLMHGKILTGDNLMKRGFAGPFRCSLCSEANENIQHIFLDCPYAISVWNEIMKPWEINIHMPSNN